MKKVIGIISYFPSNETKENRKQKLINLVKKCDELFNLPIYIETQCWTDADIDDIISSSSNVMLSINDKPLGITGARKALRKWFIDSEYDYIIMLDDDCEVFGTDATEYLRQIDNNPDCFIEFKLTLLKLFAISKYVISQYDYDDINPEDGDGFEDRIFVNKLRKMLPDRKREFFNTGLDEHSISTRDPDSTWFKNQDLQRMRDNTHRIIGD